MNPKIGESNTLYISTKRTRSITPRISHLDLRRDLPSPSTKRQPRCTTGISSHPVTTSKPTLRSHHGSLLYTRGKDSPPPQNHSVPWVSHTAAVPIHIRVKQRGVIVSHHPEPFPPDDTLDDIAVTRAALDNYRERNRK